MSSLPVIAGFLAGAGLIIVIGAQNAFVLRQGLQGRCVGLTVAVCALGDVVLIVAGVAGMGALVLERPGWILALRLGGAAFLGCHAFAAARRAWRGGAALVAARARPLPAGQVLLAGLGFTFLNPHVYLDTVVLLGSLALPYPGAGRWYFALGACLASLSWFTLLGYGAQRLRPVLDRPGVWRAVDASVALGLGALSLGLLLYPLA